MPLLAVGPPLLTLVNFEVENLAYMLVCLQWMVSWALPWPPGHTAMWQKMGYQEALLSTHANRRACHGVAYECACVQGESECAQDTVWVSSLGVEIPRLASQAGVPHSQPPTPWHLHLHGQPCEADSARTLSLDLAEKTKAQIGTVTFPAKG